jgi:hypothetical protein
MSTIEVQIQTKYSKLWRAENPEKYYEDITQHEPQELTTSKTLTQLSTGNVGKTPKSENKKRHFSIFEETRAKCKTAQSKYQRKQYMKAVFGAY